ncbi:hypothetical protein TNCV_821431 [Trichonephila clavipes]|nr:hypothetical protein TNCV_821431 [Trichonephila clavipes]
MSIVSCIVEHRAGMRLIWPDSVPNWRENTLEVVRAPLTPSILSTLQDDLRLEGFLVYLLPHRHYTDKHSCLLRDSTQALRHIILLHEPLKQCSQLASLDKNNALREIKLRLSYLQGKSTTMSVIAHQTEKEWISANEKSRQRMSQTQAEGTAKQHAARLEEAHLRAHHSCFTTSERC